MTICTIFHKRRTSTLFGVQRGVFCDLGGASGSETIWYTSHTCTDEEHCYVETSCGKLMNSVRIRNSIVNINTDFLTFRIMNSRKNYLLSKSFITMFTLITLPNMHCYVEVISSFGFVLFVTILTFPCSWVVNWLRP